MLGRVHLYENVRLAANKKRTAAAPKIAAGVNYLFSLKIFSFPLSQLGHPTVFTSSKKKFLFEKSAAEVDFC